MALSEAGKWKLDCRIMRGGGAGRGTSLKRRTSPCWRCPLSCLFDLCSTVGKWIWPSLIISVYSVNVPISFGRVSGRKPPAVRLVMSDRSRVDQPDSVQESLVVCKTGFWSHCTMQIAAVVSFGTTKYNESRGQTTPTSPSPFPHGISKPIELVTKNYIK